MAGEPICLPPISPDLLDPEKRPYFLFWTDETVGQFQELLRSADPDERAYWMEALLREETTRDIQLYVRPIDVRTCGRGSSALGRSRPIWAYHLGMNGEWPPPEARGASTACC